VLSTDSDKFKGTTIQEYLNWEDFVRRGEIALLVIDAQNDIIHKDGSLAHYGVWKCAEDNAMVDKIKSIVDTSHQSGIPVFWVRAFRPADGSDIFPNTYDGARILARRKLNPLYFAGGTWDVEIIDELKGLIDQNDRIIDKHGYSSFEGSRLDYYLRALKINTLIVCGFITDTCVEGTSRTAIDRGYMPVLLEDACATIGEEEQRLAIERHKRVLGPVVTTARMIELLKRIYSA